MFSAPAAATVGRAGDVTVIALGRPRFEARKPVRTHARIDARTHRRMHARASESENAGFRHRASAGQGDAAQRDFRSPNSKRLECRSRGICDDDDGGDNGDNNNSNKRNDVDDDIDIDIVVGRVVARAVDERRRRHV